MIVWITGASSGLGRETAKAYVKQGCIVIATARTEAGLVSLQEECVDLEGQLYYTVADVTNQADLKAAYDKMQDQWGLPDTAILNAGTHKPTPAKDIALESHRTLMEVNYYSVVACLELLVPDFCRRGSGQIAITASVAGYRGLPTASAYGASKAALINLTEAIHTELKPSGLDVRLINPGFVKTPLTDKNTFKMPFLMPVEEAAAAVVKGLAGRKFEISFPSVFVFIMKLLRFMPNSLFFMISKKMVG